VYVGKETVEGVLARLAAFKASAAPHEQEVAACILHNLFDEYRFLAKYPDRELQITARMFGGLVRMGLVTVRRAPAARAGGPPPGRGAGAQRERGARGRQSVLAARVCASSRQQSLRSDHRLLRQTVSSLRALLGPSLASARIAGARESGLQQPGGARCPVCCPARP